MIERRSRPARRRGFTILETAIAVVIVGVMLVAAIGTVGATHRMRRIGYDRPRAALLARDLMAEILMQSYEEPFELLDFGPEASEPTSNRTAFDDIDDYHGWTRSPPEARDGSALPGLDGWTRTARVVRGDPNDLAGAPGASDVGVKVITVEVLRGDRSVASLTMLRTKSWRVLPE